MSLRDGRQGWKERGETGMERERGDRGGGTGRVKEEEWKQKRERETAICMLGLGASTYTREVCVLQTYVP